MTNKFNQVLQETSDLLKERYNLNAIGEDFRSVITNEDTFDTYKDELLSSFDESTKENLGSLMENARAEILKEAALGSITNFAALDMPILVQLWARLTMTQAIPTEPKDVPAFTVTWIKPFIMGRDGKKYYLPQAINAYSDSPELTGRRPLVASVPATDGKIVDFNVLTKSGVTADELKKGVAVANGVSIVGATFSDSYDTATKATGVAVKFDNKTIITEDTNSNFYGEVEYVTGVDPTSGVPTTAKDKFFGHLNHETGVLEVQSLAGKLTAITLRGHVSEEQHTSAVNVSFDVQKEEIQIPTASHIEASLPVEFIQDVNAMYKIDGAAQVVETMSSMVQQQVDLDIIHFLQDSFDATNAMYKRTFDAIPSSDFALGAVEWRKQLRALIDWMTQSIRQDFKGYDLTFNIVGNPLDTMLLPDVEWKFQAGTQTGDGISASYGYGAFSGTASYRIISSDLIPQGALKVIGVPQRKDYKGFVFYPYSFTSTNNYQNSVNNALPSIVMSKRYQLKEFTPLIGEIALKNNDGNIYNR